MNNGFHIAVDGPVAAGKGTVCRLVAERLGFLYVDTGAMYRVAAYIAQENNLNYHDEQKIVDILETSNIDLQPPMGKKKDGRLITVLLNGEDVSWQIRTEGLGHGASQVSQLKGVREVLVRKQQQIAQGRDVVMEGRDITYRVLPDANLKIFLTGSDFVRAKRRHAQLLTKGQDLTFKQVFDDLVTRDKIDSGREHDPLKIVDDAWVVDTSDLSISEVVDVIIDRVKAITSLHR